MKILPSVEVNIHNTLTEIDDHFFKLYILVQVNLNRRLSFKS